MTAHAIFLLVVLAIGWLAWGYMGQTLRATSHGAAGQARHLRRTFVERRTGDRRTAPKDLTDWRGRERRKGKDRRTP